VWVIKEAVVAITTSVVSVELVHIDDPLNSTERGAIAGYAGNTLVSYTTDLRLFVEWCNANKTPLLEVRRAHLEIFGRTMEANGRMRSTVARRLSTLGRFYRYCHVEGILERNPAANVRRPKVDVESRTLGLDRNELGGLLVQAGLGSARDHALISLLALNGLRISEARNADITSMDMDRGHRTLAIVRKGRKARHDSSRTEDRKNARSVYRRTDQRPDLPWSRRSTYGPICRGPNRETTHETRRDNETHLTAQSSAFVHHRGTRCWRPLRDVQEAASHADPRTTMRYDRARQSLDRHATYIVAAGAARSA
jgi:integrase/recombinase XerD